MPLTMETPPRLGIIMGSRSDWPTMAHAAAILDRYQIPFEARVVSAHRTPGWLADYATSAQDRGLVLLIAGAGGAAHLPGMAAAFSLLPVVGVPVRSRSLNGLDSLLSIAQMPAGIPVLTTAIGEAGAESAGWLALRILALQDPALRQRLREGIVP